MNTNTHVQFHAQAVDSLKRSIDALPLDANPVAMQLMRFAHQAAIEALEKGSPCGFAGCDGVAALSVSPKILERDVLIHHARNIVRLMREHRSRCGGLGINGCEISAYEVGLVLDHIGMELSAQDSELFL